MLRLVGVALCAHLQMRAVVGRGNAAACTCWPAHCTCGLLLDQRDTSTIVTPWGFGGQYASDWSPNSFYVHKRASVMTNFDPMYAVPPAATVIECADAYNIPRDTLMKKLDMEERMFDSFLRGDVRINEVLARRLSTVLCMEPGFWRRLDAYFVIHRTRGAVVD